MWVTPRRLPHLVFIGTSSVLFALINWMKVPAYLALGAFPHEVVVAALLLMPLAIVSTLLTVRWMKRINPERFYVLIYALMVLLGAKLLWDGLAGQGATAAAKTRRLRSEEHTSELQSLM